MSERKLVGEFNAKWTTIGIMPGAAGDMIVQGNFEGMATGYGAVLGTLTATPAGHRSGTFKTHAIGFPGNGQTVSASGQGSFEAVAEGRWRTQSLMTDSTGQQIVGEGEIDLDSRTWWGKLYVRD